MSDTRHAQPRCAICGWPYRPDLCNARGCGLRPPVGSTDHATQVKRTAARDRLVAAGNPTPTLEDVDAELAPKGLPVIELNGPTWVGPWVEVALNVHRRTLLADYPLNPTTWTCQVQREVNGTWEVTRLGYPPADERGCYGHPTPEAAQQACEAAIVAAWRNR